ncbi:MAG: signal peptide peptidase SppA [Anaerolineae bacterium]
MSDLFRNAYLALSNRLRLLRKRRLGYVVLRARGSFPERNPRRTRPFPLSLLPWPSPPPSIEAFHDALERLATDPRVEGIVILISGLMAGPATLASLRQAVGRFRQSGKRVVAYPLDQGMWAYYLAAACDEIWLPEGAGLQSAGMWSETVFLKDSLAMLGVEADFEAVGNYKVSPDTFRRSDMSEPHREMLASILASIYEHVVTAIADGRALAPGAVRDLLDGVPLTAGRMREAGLADGVCYEDELAARLGTDGEPATLVTWAEARKRLVRPVRWRSRRAVGVISLEGMILTGSSRQPPIPLPLPLPLPEEQAGSETLADQLRAAARDDAIAAVVLHIDSPGGSSLASDLIWREVARLREVKPVVVYMSNRAASGGYYVAAPASEIVAQPTTLTGSIGIWGGKLVTRGLYEKLGANREMVSRGKMAGLYADDDAFTEEERARIRDMLGDGYARFSARVAEGRNMTGDEVEAVAGGRVWTGAQALEAGLVDALGDLQFAAGRARSLAGMDEARHVPLVGMAPPKTHLSPLPPTGDETGEWLSGLMGLLREGAWALAPWQVRIRD